MRFNNPPDKRRPAGWKTHPNYIPSRTLSAMATERDGGKCRRCHSRDGLQTHHLNYQLLASDPLDDVVTLCSGCHLKEHTRLKGPWQPCTLPQWLERHGLPQEARP